MSSSTIIPAFRLIGLRLPHTTTNTDGQSGIDCGNLWQQFETEELATKITGRLGDEIYAVYFDYEGDHTQPFSYFIGCKVDEGAAVPQGMDSLALPEQQYHQVVAAGVIPAPGKLYGKQSRTEHTDTTLKYTMNAAKTGATEQ